MKVLITGGMGFIGSHLADRLLARGDEVCVIDNFATGRADNLKPQENLIIVEDDICNNKSLEYAFAVSSPDVVIHAAASYKNPSDWVSDANTNCVGTARVIKKSEEHNVDRLIYFQTSLCYGLYPEIQPIPIDAPLKPEGSSYAITKTAGENLISLSNLDFISFRLANCYGDANLSGPVPTFYQRLSEGKKCFVMNTRRDYIFIHDLCDVVMRAIDGEGTKGYYHISTGSDYSIKELYDAVRKAMGLPEDDVEVRERYADDAPSLLIDPAKTHKDFFGWKAETSLEEGIEEAVRWYKSHKFGGTFTHLKGINDD